MHGLNDELVRGRDELAALSTLLREQQREQNSALETSRDLYKKRADAMADVQRKRAQLEEVTGAVESKTEMLKGVELKLATLRGAIRDARKSEGAVEREKLVKESALKEVELEIHASTERLRGLRETLGTMDERKRHLAADIKEQGATLNSLHAQIDAASAASAELIERRAAMQRKIGETKASLEGLKAEERRHEALVCETRRLETTLSEREALLSSVTKELEEKREMHRAAEGIQDELSALRSERDQVYFESG